MADPATPQEVDPGSPAPAPRPLPASPRRPWRLTEPPPPTGTPLPAAPGIARIVAPNPGPMTYHGTNSWVVSDAGGSIVIDPGSDAPEHLAAIRAAAGPVRLILLTHTHKDHLGGARGLSALTGAPVGGYRLSADPDFTPDLPLEDGDRAGPLTVLHTPGHAMDHLCFAGPDGILFCGDHVMGWSSSVVPPPPHGDLILFLAQLHRLRARADRLLLTGHGPAIADPVALLDALIRHRQDREAWILRLIGTEPQPLARLLRGAYPGLDPALGRAAEANLLAHLDKLVRDGKIVQDAHGYRLLAEHDRAAERFER